MKYLFWTSGILLIPLLGSSVFFYSLYLGTGEHVPKRRAIEMYRWSVVLVLGTFNIWIFARVIDGIRALIH
jgi:hypothetical protein